jgi:uncharacterized membrane protein YedE/YeeE
MARKLRVIEIVAGLAILAGLTGAVAAIAADITNVRLALALAFGAIFGFVLQRSRFCFFCHTRDLVEDRDPSGALSILLALAIGAVGYALVMSQWLPIPAPGRLPPTAHIGPVSLALVGAAFAFGLGMAISGSCISAHLYRLGEGSAISVFALLGSLVGFGLGFVTWNPLYLAVISEGSVVWLPQYAGYGGALASTLAVLAGLAVVAVVLGRGQGASAASTEGLRALLRSVFVNRWPAAVGGAAVGVLSAAYYLRIAPLGVTAELGSVARTASVNLGLVPDTLHGLDGFRGCATAIRTLFVSENGLFVAGLVAASFAAALIAGQFAPRWPRPSEVARGLAGGVLMGWGAMTALGCTVGVLLSGIHAAALSGWVFLAACLAGILLWLRLKRLIAA